MTHRRALAALLTALCFGCGGPAADSPPDDLTPERLATGREVFARACSSCHGSAGEGSRLAPDLTDGEWLHGSGGIDEIARVVEEGVAAPLRFPSPMPPGGGVALNGAELRTVGMYVWSLSHPSSVAGLTSQPPTE